MKTVSTLAAILCGLTLLATTAQAGKTQAAGAVCMRYSSSEAPKTSEYVTSVGQLCNDSATERLRVLCPLTQHGDADDDAYLRFDYVDYNLHGLNGQQNTYPEEEFLCNVFTRTRYAEGYYYGNWASAADVSGYGATPTALYASAAMQDDGFITGICYVPSKYGTQRSCVSHLQLDEH